MKIAIPVKENNYVDEHFGHCSFYAIFTISEDGKVQNKERLDSPQGCGCKSNIASVLAEQGVSIMLAGGIGAGAINVLNNSGIEVIRGCTGNIDELVNLYIQGTISDSGSSCHQHETHHGNGNNHQCQH